jgi:hypothetical protein
MNPSTPWKFAAATIYSLLLLLSLAMAAISLRANAHLPWSWRPEFLSVTILPFSLFLGTVVVAQATRPTASWHLPLQCAVVGALLLFSLVSHGFPERSNLFGTLHIAMAVLCSAWNVYVVVKAPNLAP